MAGASDTGPGRVERLRERVERERERYGERGRIYRAAWVTAALIVTLAGLAMIVFPGPALLVIPIGLAMLSLQFAWAQALLDKGFARGQAAADLAAQASRQQKILAGAAVVFAIACVAAVAAYVFL